MATKTYEDEVRRRYQDFLAAAGISENRVATEILYWLPHEFMEAYRELFAQALQLGDGTKSGVNRLGENVVRQVKKPRGGKGSMRATQGSGSGYKNAWVIRDERALEVKRRVDRALVSLVPRTKARVYQGDQRLSGTDSSWRERGEEGKETRGNSPGGLSGERGLVTMRGGGNRKCCRTCGKLSGNGWVICPFAH